MKDALVGYTGFVGSNLSMEHNFSGLYNSKNIEDSFGTNPDLLVYSGVPAAMFLANNFPDQDLAVIKEAEKNILRINPEKVVLISTIAVYDNPDGIDENADIDEGVLPVYGRNRRLLEKFVEEHYPDHLIVRLPALYGRNIHKNFIYDFIHVIPSLLTYKKFAELSSKDDFIKDFYIPQKNGFYKCRELNLFEQCELKEYFRHVGFSALNFTDSRSVYQFYSLVYLWEHIETAAREGIRIMNMAVEPVMAGDLYHFLTGERFENHLSRKPFYYDYRTKYAGLFGGRNGYIFSRKKVLQDIKAFVGEEV